MIPVGTTARQIEALARWMLACLMAQGMLLWWWPGYHAWGALAGALLVVLGLWLVSRIAAGDRTVPGSPVYLALIGPAVILVGHIVVSLVAAGPQRQQAVGGAIDLSMLYVLLLLAAGVMLSQSLLPKAASHVVLLSVCGAVMILGVAAALLWGRCREATGSLALLGFAGIGVWLTPLWGAAKVPEASPPQALRLRPLRWGCIAVAIVAASAFAAVSPRQGLLAGGIVVATFVLGAMIFQQHRKAVLLAGAVLLLASAITAVIFWPKLGVLRKVPAGILGRGGSAFRDVSTSDSGLVILGATVGWLGLMWLLGGLIVSLVWLLSRARRGSGSERALAIVWTATTAIAFSALLAPGGLFIPAVTLAAAFTLGLLPAMLGSVRPRRSGWLLLPPLVGLMLLLGLSTIQGLPLWSAGAFGAKDYVLHGLTGFFLTMVLVWLLGAHSVRLGLVGAVLSILVGGLGEVLQYAVPHRSAEFSDFWAYLIGSAPAVLLYLLAVGSRWRESIDARPNGELQFTCGRDI